VKRSRCERVTEHVQMTVHNFQLLAKVPLQQQVNIPRCAVPRGENLAFRSTADMCTKCVHNLNWNWNISDGVLCIRCLSLPAPHGLTNTNELSKRKAG
jgi:hypothetical protein